MFKNKDTNKETPREKALKWEEKILATQGLIKNENVWVYDVPIKGLEKEKEPQFIHTIEAGKENENVLVFIHGYGGAGVYMWKIMA